MAKSKARTAARARKHARKEAWKLMTPEARQEWNEKRRSTATSGYPKRQRERNNGRPMASRTGEGLGKSFVPPRSQPCSDFGPWLRQFWAMTAA